MPAIPFAMRFALSLLILSLAVLGCRGREPQIEAAAQPALKTNVSEPSQVDPPAPTADEQEWSPPPPSEWEKPLIAYLERHSTLYQKQGPDFFAAVELLKADGDLYTVHVCDQLQHEGLGVSKEKSEALGKLATAIRESHSTKLRADDVERLLERAAYADVACHFVEHTLRDWTLQYVAQSLSDPAVCTELEHIASSSIPDNEQAFSMTTATKTRARFYARRLLRDPSAVE